MRMELLKVTLPVDNPAIKKLCPEGKYSKRVPEELFTLPLPVFIIM